MDISKTNKQSCFMRLHQVLEVFPVSRAKFYKGIQAGEYPKPLKHGRMSLWRSEDIQNLLKQVEESSNG